MAEDQSGISGYIVKNLTGIGALMVSAFVGFSGYSMNRTNQEVASINSCRERTLALYDNATQFVEAGTNRAPTAIAHSAARLAIDSQFVELTCSGASMPVSAELSGVLGEVSRMLPKGSSKNLIQNTADAAETNNKAAQPRPEASIAPVIAVSQQPDPDGRLFIQISDERQRGRAEALRDTLARDAPVSWPLTVVNGIELAGPVHTNELRCLKAADCVRAKPLADAIVRAGGLKELRVIDLSARFERSEKVKPGTYELWLAADALMPSPSK